MFGISYVTFVFCIMYYAPNRLLPGCVARAAGLLPYAIIKSLAVLTDHWFPLKTRLPNTRSKFRNRPKNRNPRPPKIARRMSLKKRPIGRENCGTGNTGGTHVHVRYMSS